MIQRKLETKQFTLEIKLKLNDSSLETSYKGYIKTLIDLIAGALYSGSLFSFFMKELEGVAERLLLCNTNRRSIKRRGLIRSNYLTNLKIVIYYR